MHITRLFIDNDLEVGQALDLPEKSAHHVLHVLRKKIQDELVLFNGRGGEYPATISNIKRSEVTVSILGYDSINRESPLQITLGLSVLKRDAMNTSLQKATELGVTRIIPVETTNTSVSRKHIEKRESQWQQVIQSACEQSGRTQLPNLESAHAFNDFLRIENESLKLIPSPTAEAALSNIKSPAKSICIIIGPEGGFTDDEVADAIRSDYQPVTIGERVLRAETVPTVLLSLLQYRWGDF